MSDIVLPLLVQKVSEQYHLDGGISPFIDVFPAVELPDGRQVTRLYLPIEAIEDLTLAPKDKINIVITEDGETSIEVKEESDHPRIPLITNTCPICGAQLLPPRSKQDIGRCIHRACPAQMPHYILLMLSALGLSFDQNMRHILEQIVSRGILTTPVAIWSLSIEDLVNPNASLLDVQMFIQYLHSVRGHCSVQQAMMALNITDWSAQFVRAISLYSQAKNLNLLHLKDLVDPKCPYRKGISSVFKDLTSKTKDNTDYWKIFDTFLSIGTNKQMYQQLMLVLFA